MKKIPADYLYLSSIILLVSATVIDMSTAVEAGVVNQLVSAAKYVSIIIMIICSLLKARELDSKNNASRTWIVFLIISVLISILTFLSSGEKAPLLISVLIAGAFGRNYDRITKCAFVTVVITSLFIILLSITGAIKLISVAETGDEPNVIIYRYAFGFSHPNLLGMAAVAAVLLRIINRKGRIKLTESLIYILVSVLLVVLVKTRTAAVVIIFSLLVALSMNMCNSQEEGLKRGYRAVLILSGSLAMLGIVLPLLYRSYPAEFSWIDNLLSFRLSYASNYIDKYSITLFGQSLKIVGTLDAAAQGVQPAVLDNSYYYALLGYGIVPAALLAGSYCACGALAWKYGQTGVFIVMCSTTLLGISETFPLTVLGALFLTYIFAEKK